MSNLAHDLGRDAYHRNVCLYDNPFRTGSDNAIDWAAGWQFEKASVEGQNANVEKQFTL